MSSVNQRFRANLGKRIIKGPEDFRLFLERMGPTFIKIGQFLALRPDLLPQEYCDELMLLLDRVPPFPWAEARAVLETELGPDRLDAYSFIDPEPVAAGSLAQTHFARLRDATEVAVKVQRPNIRARVQRDLRRARLLVRVLELSRTELIISPREVLREVSDWMMQELDFTLELANMTRLYHLTHESPNEVVPRPYPDLSTGKVLTAEYLHGTRFTTLLGLVRSGPEGKRRLAEMGLDREALAGNLLFACLTQIFRYQFFHADLHPGNLIALSGDAIGFVDFGLCDELDPVVRERQMRYLQAVYADDLESMFRSLVDILIPTEKTNFEAFRRDFFDVTGTWQSRSKPEALEFGEYSAAQGRSPTGEWMVNVMRAARENGLQVPSRILSMYRALLTAEAVANRLEARLDLGSVGRRFFQLLQTQELLKSLEPEAVQAFQLNLFNLIRDSPVQLQQLLEDLSNGHFSINVNRLESPKLARTVNRRTKLLATAIISVGVALLLAHPALPAFGGISAAWPLGVGLALLYLSLALQWYRLR
jgi:ubiquinone biosynthesis protein